MARPDNVRKWAADPVQSMPFRRQGHATHLIIAGSFRTTNGELLRRIEGVVDQNGVLGGAANLDEAAGDGGGLKGGGFGGEFGGNDGGKGQGCGGGRGRGGFVVTA